jgi:hypothetical protein
VSDLEEVVGCAYHQLEAVNSKGDLRRTNVVKPWAHPLSGRDQIAGFGLLVLFKTRASQLTRCTSDAHQSP